jgi:hypothetical protein
MLAGEVMLLALAFYYTGWVRYFTRGRTPALLYKPLLGIPLPLAVSPVDYFRRPPWRWSRRRLPAPPS